MFDFYILFQTAKLAQVEAEMKQIDDDIESLTNGKEMLMIVPYFSW